MVELWIGSTAFASVLELIYHVMQYISEIIDIERRHNQGRVKATNQFCPMLCRTKP